MSKRNSDWDLPPEALGLLSTLFLVPCTALLVASLVPIVGWLKKADVTVLVGVALSAGLVGACLLLAARLPLYRRRRFWTFGPRQLDRRHRRFYWSAYAFISAALLLLWIVWLRTK